MSENIEKIDEDKSTIANQDKKLPDYEYYNYENKDYLVLNKSKVLANKDYKNSEISYCLDKEITIYLLISDNDDFLIMLEIGDKVVRGFEVPKDNPFVAFDMFYTIKECYR